MSHYLINKINMSFSLLTRSHGVTSWHRWTERDGFIIHSSGKRNSSFNVGKQRQLDPIADLSAGTSSVFFGGLFGLLFPPLTQRIRLLNCSKHAHTHPECNYMFFYSKRSALNHPPTPLQLLSGYIQHDWLLTVWPCSPLLLDCLSSLW